LLGIRKSLNLNCGQTKGIYLESIFVDNLEVRKENEYDVDCTNIFVEDNNPFFDSKNVYALYT
jgi:hypothetical protein